MKGNVNEFIDFLTAQVGQPYVWGGQHLQLTPSNYESVITRKESDPVYRLQAISYCKARFDMGATVLYGYDCSGLGMYWLQNVKKIYGSDMNANSMMSKCELTDTPKRGYWVFRVNDTGKASHIGYMVSDSEVVHAKGRAYGVVKEAYRSSYWHKVGIPSCMEWDEPIPPKPEPTLHKYVRVKRKCRIRAGNGSSFKTLLIARVGQEFPILGQADKDPYWFQVSKDDIVGYITCNQRYTEEVDKI